MNISELSLRRPVLAIVINLLILLFGIIGFTFLGVRDYPAIDPPNVSVRTSYTGANADIIESQITEPLEKAINSVPGIRNITSSSSQGTSSINVEFNIEIPLEEAANDVRDKVSQAIRSLPNDLESPPVVSKADASSESILSMAVRSNTRNQLEITEFANNVLVDRLQTIPGVSGIQIWGQKDYAMRIWLKPEKMSSRGVTANEVSAALARENVELPSGKIAGESTELTVRTFGRLNSEEEFNNVIIRSDGNGIIRLQDVQRLYLAPKMKKAYLRKMGCPPLVLPLFLSRAVTIFPFQKNFTNALSRLKRNFPKISPQKFYLTRRCISKGRCSR
jgi:multidrug efflux pump